MDRQSNGTGTAEDSCLIPTDTVFNFVHCMHWHWTVSLGFFCWAGVQVDVCHGHSVFHQLTAPIALIVAVCAHHMCITNEHLDQGQGRGNGTLFVSA